MRAPRIVAFCALLAASSCQPSSESTERYAPGGEYHKQLDARGKRHIVHGAKDAVLAKIRVRKDGEVRVFDKDRVSLGSVRMRDGKVVIERRGAKPAGVEWLDDDTITIGANLRLERVERGWAVFDGKAQPLGYVQWVSPDRLALRDDYSSAPRLFAGPEDTSARTPSGARELDVRPPYPVIELMPLALGGDADALDRVALGMWLLAQRPEGKPDASD